MKKVSVVMCTYNGAKYLREQLDSIVNQTYPIYELIIQDDRSTDETVRIIEEYEKDYAYIKLFINKQNLGAHPNFFDAMTKATGEFIAISDQDDIWEKDKIEQLINTIGGTSLCVAISKPFGESGLEVHYDPRIPNYHLERLAFLPALLGHNMLFKRNLLDKRPESIYLNYAYDLIIAILANVYGGISVCDKVLTHHRVHPNALSFTEKRNYSKTLSNMLHFFMYALQCYRKNKARMMEHFDKMYELYNVLPLIQQTDIYSKDMVYLLSQKRSVVAFLKIGIISVRLRDGIFHAKEKNTLLAIIRAFFNQILVSTYYQY